MTSRIAATVLATAAICASAGANAFTSNFGAHAPAADRRALQVQAQAFHGPAIRPVHRPVREVYGSAEGHEPGYGERRHRRCGAPRWDPSVRYMPGQVVWRQGELWVANPISARVWNENSPPEWTPNYWAPAVCG